MRTIIRLTEPMLSETQIDPIDLQVIVWIFNNYTLDDFTHYIRYIKTVYEQKGILIDINILLRQLNKGLRSNAIDGLLSSNV